MNEQEVREIVRDEAREELREMRREFDEALAQFRSLVATDRYIFQKDLELFNGRNFIFSLEDGTQIGTDGSQKLAFWGSVPKVQAGRSAHDASTSTVSDAGDTTSNAAINSAITELENKHNELVNTLTSYGLFSGPVDP